MSCHVCEKDENLTFWIGITSYVYWSFSAENEEDQEIMVNGIEGSSSEEEEEDEGDSRVAGEKQGGGSHNEPNSTTNNHSPSSNKQGKGRCCWFEVSLEIIFAIIDVFDWCLEKKCAFLTVILSQNSNMACLILNLVDSCSVIIS
jgi:hypothetical protein